MNYFLMADISNIEGKLYHILSELERLGDSDKDVIGQVSALRQEVNRDMLEIKIEIAQLQVKAGIWGGIAGAIPIIIMLMIKWIKG